MDMEKQIFQHSNQEIVGEAIGEQGEILSDLKSQGFDPESLWERVAFDLDLLSDLVGIFDQEFPGMLGWVEAAVQQSSAVELAKAAHKIKGSLLQFSGIAAAATAVMLNRLDTLVSPLFFEPLNWV